MARPTKFVAACRRIQAAIDRSTASGTGSHKRRAALHRELAEWATTFHSSESYDRLRALKGLGRDRLQRAAAADDDARGTGAGRADPHGDVRVPRAHAAAGVVPDELRRPRPAMARRRSPAARARAAVADLRPPPGR